MMHFFSAGLRRGVLTAALGLLGTSATLAQTVKAFTPGNYVVARIGDGTAALSGTSAAVFLLEYTPAGTLVQTVALPTANAGTSFALTETGSSTSDANLTRSADGRYLLLTGYNTPPGTATLSGTTATNVNRIVARVAADGTVDTSTRLSASFSATTVRAAASVNGSAFYVVGGNSGVVYVPFGNGAAAKSLNTAAPTNLRSVSIASGNLYVSSGSGAFIGVDQVGTGLPTAPTQAITLLPGFDMPANTTQAMLSPNAFFLTDQSAAVAGPDVLYVADDGAGAVGGIQKWSLVNGTWVLNGTITGTGAGLRGLTGSQAATVVTLVASGTGGLFAVTDTGGYNAGPSTTALPTALATAGTNAVFRGVALAPLATALASHSAASLTGVGVYPNPTHGQLTITLPQPGAASVALHDLTGRLVLAPTALPVSGQLNLPASLAVGTYLLRVQQGEAATVRRVVVE